jgi:hypothetical protein
VVFPKEKMAGALFVTDATEQLSDVTGAPNATPDAVQIPASEFTDTSAGHAIVGFSVSFTVTVCEHVAVFPDPSVTVHVTVVAPNGKIAGALFVTDATEQLSDVVGAPRATPLAVHNPASAETVTFAGQLIVGNCVSLTVTVCVQVAVNPAPSVTVHVTVVIPSGNVTGALFVTDATEQLSDVVGEPNATPDAVHVPAPASTVTFAGHAIVGAWLSVTVTI